MPQTPHIANAEQAALLAEPAHLPAIHALMREPLSVGDLARCTGRSERAAYTLMHRLRAAGIVRQVGTRPHRGRAVRLFQAWQPWFVPFEATGAATLGEFLHTQMAGRQRRMLEAIAAQMLGGRPDWGHWLEVGPRGGRLELGHRDGPAPHPKTWGPREGFYTLRELRLRDADAAEFRARLWALLREFETRAEAGAPAEALSVMLSAGDWWDEGEGSGPRSP